MRSVPVVTVLMSVRNGGSYLVESLESIINQTVTNFEFIIIDDGSTDLTWEILQQYAEIDSRFVLLRNEHGIGLAKSLNRGLDLARGEYIARMDSDDISLPGRFEKQLKFLQLNPHVGVLGTNLLRINSKNDVLPDQVPSYPLTPNLIRWNLLFRNCLGHPSVMVRDAVFQLLGGYNDEYESAQDYELWTRASFHFDMANLSDALLKYRVYEQSISSARFDEQNQYLLQGVRNYLERLGIESDQSIVKVILHPGKASNATENFRAAKIIETYYQHWQQNNNASEEEIKAVISDAVTRLVNQAVAGKMNLLIMVRVIRFAVQISARQTWLVLMRKLMMRLRKYSFLS